jgi:hypothetical protein
MIDTVRRTSIISALLVVVLVMSASACVAGWGNPPATSCSHASTRRVCAREKAGIKTAVGAACGHILKSLSGWCGIRSFAQSQFVAFRAFKIASPVLRASGGVSAPFGPAIIVSSIGSPETDRGPPRS